MSIKDLPAKIKPFMAKIGGEIYSEEQGLKIHNDLYIVLMLVLVGTASYGLGILSSYEKSKTPIAISKNSRSESLTASVLESTQKIPSPTRNDGEVVASKSGTKYYYPWCSGVSRIKEENKVWFKSIADAKAKGLTPAANCDGLE